MPQTLESVPPFIAEALRGLKVRLRDRLGERLQDVRLYGSWARGEPRVGSDIDVIVIVRGLTPVDQRWILEQSVALMIEGGPALSALVMSAERFSFLLSKEVGFALDVEREGIAA